MAEQENDKVYASLVFSKPKIGLAIYRTESATLEACELNEHNTTDFPILQHFLYQANPSIIITPSSNNEGFLNLLKEKAMLDVGKQKDFNADNARISLLRVNLPGMPDFSSPKEKLVYLAAYINLDLNCMIRAIGGLIDYVIKTKSLSTKEDEDKLELAAIKQFRTEEIMLLDPATYESLQIFKHEEHPSALGVGKAKEGLSLYGILNKCVSTIGKNMLRFWMLNPSCDITLLNERLNTVAFFIKPDQVSTAGKCKEFLKKAKDITSILHRFQAKQGSVNDWINLYNTMASAIQIKVLLAGSEGDVPIKQKVISSISDNLIKLINIINSTIDLPASKDSNKLSVRAGVSAELDELRSHYAGFDELLDTIGKEELKRFANISSLRIMYFPQIGFQLAVPVQEKVVLPGFNFQFQSESYAYYKNDTTTELDNHFGDIHTKITELEVSVVQELVRVVFSFQSHLAYVSDILAELDCFLAFATVALEYNYTCPSITEDNVLYISNGRHPLQELCVESSFIPNDTAIAYGREGTVKLITGPNFSGKSVYLKQVALITFMAHIGSFVPASAALIGITDKIYTRVHSRESISTGLSSFMIDLQQIMSMLNNATGRSLLIIDEFGKGTAHNDGVALLTATINHFLQLQQGCPKVLVCTHFTEIFENHFFDGQDNLDFLTMDILIKEHENRPELVFLYKLIKGYAAYSYGIYCAFISGIPMELIERAQTIANKLQKSEMLQPINKVDSVVDVEGIIKKLQEFDAEKSDVKSFLLTLNH